ncbi:MAG: hypothetical protein ACT4NY_16685 [Pseudonocardiales bacterium]
MTTKVSSHRQRAAVSLSIASSEPVEQLDHAVDALHRVNRALPRAALGREELIALGGLLTQISGALLTLADLLSGPAQDYDSTRLLRAEADALRTGRLPSASTLLQDCRNGFFAAGASARAFHADLRRCPPTRTHRGNGRTSSKNTL